MAKIIAALLCAGLIWWLFRLDRNPKVRVSKAVWIPLLWLLIAASRNISDWLQMSGGGAGDYTEGSPLDRAVLSVILAFGVVVLARRGTRVWALVRSNLPILLYFVYCGISVLWSDFPDVAFKRWFRACGDIVMVLVLLSEPDWLAAVKRLLSRLGFLLVPVSILFIRYYPQLGRVYTRSGRPTWVGVATDKNALGMLCLICGLASIYRFLEIWKGKEGEGSRKKNWLIAQGLLIAMTMYLIKEADSATAFACCGMAGGVMVLTYLYRWARRPVILNSMVAAVIGIAFGALFLGIGSGMVEDLGRDSSLTGRTAIWTSVLKQVHNPIVGTGFESFWIGPRRFKVMADIDQGVNQAHNGYLEIYLNLGWVGIAILATLIVAGYRRIIPAVRRQTQAGSLRLAYFIVAIAYNFTEGGFKMMHPVWIVFLLSTAIPPRVPAPSRSKTRAQLDEARLLAKSADADSSEEERKASIVAVNLATR
jgi:exopolysaccharide production protein ExoQ